MRAALCHDEAVCVWLSECGADLIDGRNTQPQALLDIRDLEAQTPTALKNDFTDAAFDFE